MTVVRENVGRIAAVLQNDYRFITDRIRDRYLWGGRKGEHSIFRLWSGLRYLSAYIPDLSHSRLRNPVTEFSF